MFRGAACMTLWRCTRASQSRCRGERRSNVGAAEDRGWDDRKRRELALEMYKEHQLLERAQRSSHEGAKAIKFTSEVGKFIGLRFRTFTKSVESQQNPLSFEILEHGQEHEDHNGRTWSFLHGGTCTGDYKCAGILYAST